jgi:three-Cys-motif partner protein
MSKAASNKVYRLQKHSLAKIACYKRYLEIYLVVLANTSFKKIYLLDLFAGEGRDVDGKSCSSIAAAEVLKEHYSATAKKCEAVVLFLNDSGNSVIEKNVKKIDRIKRFIEEIGLPKNVEVIYSEKKFDDLIKPVINRLKQFHNGEKALCFIDPFGYKYSKVGTIKDLLANGKTEVLLFIPICFMHRFAGKALKDEDFVEGVHIEEFVTELFQGQLPDTKNQVTFIKDIQSQFRAYLNIPYVDVLYIEKEKNQYFTLFFFSNSKRGFQKMLDAKWTIDEENGHGFKVNHGSIIPSLFENVDHENYTHLLYDELKKRKEMSNQEVFDFGLMNNHLPKHSKKVLDELKEEKKIEVMDENGNKALGYYLEDNHEKKAFIKII